MCMLMAQQSFVEKKSFPRFSELPVELRLMIWKHLLPGPRIVHLERRALRTDNTKDWWKRVRSDQPIGGFSGDECDEFGDIGLSYKEAEALECHVAIQRLLSRDANYNGTIGKIAAKKLLNSVTRQRYEREQNGISHATRKRSSSEPPTLFGFYSESRTPVLLLVNRETNTLASKTFRRAFTALGAQPQTYFDFENDTLYLDELTQLPHNQRHSPAHDLDDLLHETVSPSDFDQVRHLAVSLYGINIPWDWVNYHHPSDGIEENSIAWLSKIHLRFPSLMTLSLVNPHHCFPMKPVRSLYKQHYRTLKFVDVKYGGQEVRLHGYKLGNGVRNSPRNLGGDALAFQFNEWQATAEERWKRDHSNSSRTWNLPRIKHHYIMNEAEEKRLLDEGRKAALENPEGFWYINPNDSTDFEETPDEGIDEELADLLDWS